MYTFLNDKILDEEGREIMMDWETNLMQEHAKVVTENGGDILEIGFGMGISAGYMHSHSINSHTIIENHPQIIEKAKDYTRWCLMLKINQIEDDNKILIEIKNERPIGTEAGKVYKNIGIFLRPSTDYGDIGQERNVTASEDYLNILKDEELEVTNIENLNQAALANVVLATEESPLKFKFGNGDGYKRRLSLITKTPNEKVFDIAKCFKLIQGSDQKRLGCVINSTAGRVNVFGTDPVNKSGNGNRQLTGFLLVDKNVYLVF